MEGGVLEPAGVLQEEERELEVPEIEGGELEPAGVLQEEEEELEVPEVEVKRMLETAEVMQEEEREVKVSEVEVKVERVLEGGVSKVVTEKEQELEMRMFESKEEVNSEEKKSVTEPE